MIDRLPGSICDYRQVTPSSVVMSPETHLRDGVSGEYFTRRSFLPPLAECRGLDDALRAALHQSTHVQGQPAVARRHFRRRRGSCRGPALNRLHPCPWETQALPHRESSAVKLRASSGYRIGIRSLMQGSEG